MSNSKYISLIQEEVDKLTPEEREEFKDLIQECFAREKEIEENREKSHKALKEFKKNFEWICQTIVKMNVDLEKVKQDLTKTKTFLDNLSKKDSCLN
jgi:peptidoglycan hydrolase CwlO-like protein